MYKKKNKHCHNLKVQEKGRERFSFPKLLYHMDFSLKIDPLMQREENYASILED